MTDSQRLPSLLQAFIPILFLIVLLSLNVYYFGDGTLDGSNQIALILAGGIAAIVALKVGYSWSHMLDGIVNSISSAMSSILILLLIGALAGTWLISGIVPAMIYYGLQILNPTIFLFAACIVSAIVSVATGSSWSTIATLGIALLGIGQTLGLGEGVVAGAIISGAYFGDKMSPLSDTTNLAPAMAGTDLFTHIRYMAFTTGPTIIITLIIFLIWGFMNDSEADIDQIAEVQAAIQAKFDINFWLFLVPAAVIFMIVKKVSAIPALLIGSLLGGIFAIIFQPSIIETISGISGNFFEASYRAVMVAMYGHVSIITENEMVNSLLSTGGMYGMLNTIWLIICAMVFGGIMESTKMLSVITASIIKLANSTGSLVAATAGTCVFFNITASDQYLAIVVPGRMFAETYKERDLKPEVLSRTLEDAGTVTSVLIPWNTCGATQSSVLGVSTWTYAPYCFFNIISPFMTILFAYLNIKIRRFSDK
ncbi:MAG: NhaC family Na+:H+ antiporter [Marivirga sp.]|jgi:NhaC family Na+:H+ antiporter